MGPSRALQGPWGCGGLGPGQGCAWVGVPGQGGGSGCPGSGRGYGEAVLPGTPASEGCRFPKPPAHAGEPAPTGVTASCRRASAGGCGKGQGRGGALLHLTNLLLPHPAGDGGQAARCPPSNGDITLGRASGGLRSLNRQADGSLPPPPLL